MQLAEFKTLVTEYSKKGHPEKITLLGWFLHAHGQQEHFSAANVKSCYDKLHDPCPSSLSGYFLNLVTQKVLLKNSSGYRLSGTTRDVLDGKYKATGYKVQITQLLQGLPQKIPDLAERTYLNEALICYEHGAFRAAVVMTWNLAYHHLCDFVLTQRRDDFNNRWYKKLPGQHKNGQRSVVVMDDFMEELKESEVIAICKDEGIITKDIWKIMDDKLGRRNSAAHASSVSIDQLQADAFIDDLVKNVVLKIK
jgi:hypothetical protein